MSERSVNWRAVKRSLAPAIALLMAGAAVLGDTDRAHNPAASAAKRRVNLIDKDGLSQGGVILPIEIGRGVACPEESGNKVPLSWSDRTATAELFGAQLLTDTWYDTVYEPDVNDQTVYAGLESAPEYGGYVALSDGWALRHPLNSSRYELYHFQTQRTGSEQVLNTTDKLVKFAVGKVVGQEVASTSLVNLEMGDVQSWTDGQTTVTIHSDRPNVFWPHNFFEPKTVKNRGGSNESIETIGDGLRAPYPIDYLDPPIEVDLQCAH